MQPDFYMTNDWYTAEVLEADRLIIENGADKNELVTKAYAELGRFSVAWLRFLEEGQAAEQQLSDAHVAMRRAVGAVYS